MARSKILPFAALVAGAALTAACAQDATERSRSAADRTAAAATAGPTASGTTTPGAVARGTSPGTTAPGTSATTGSTVAGQTTMGAGEHTVPGETSVLGQPMVDEPAPVGSPTMGAPSDSGASGRATMGSARATGGTVTMGSGDATGGTVSMGSTGAMESTGTTGTSGMAASSGTTRTLGTVAMPGAAAAAGPAGASTSSMAAAPGAGQLDVMDQVQTRNGLRYACTGVGLDARQDPRWRDFAAKLVFTVEGGGYLPDVLTRISDAQGRETFSGRCDGPWLLVDLPAGRYDVVATAQDPGGQVHRHEASLSIGSSGQTERIIRFPEMPR